MYKGEIGGSYYEAILILSSIISGSASILWPGENIDRKRFVELLIRYNNTENKFYNISLPLLAESSFLNEEQRTIIFDEYRKKSFAEIVTGKGIDIPEYLITSKFPEIDKVELRKYSYANIFYKYIRSSIVHEYGLSEFASDFPQTEQDVFVSYINYMNHPYRRICFHFDKMVEVIENISTEISFIMKDAPIELPQIWWLDGADVVTRHF